MFPIVGKVTPDVYLNFSSTNLSVEIQRADLWVKKIDIYNIHFIYLTENVIIVRKRWRLFCLNMGETGVRELIRSRDITISNVDTGRYTLQVQVLVLMQSRLKVEIEQLALLKVQSPNGFFIAW
jgi:hypothetical protein